MADEPLDELVSSKRAYKAMLVLITSWSVDFRSTDLSTLWVEMELTANERSHDPAMYNEWNEFWGIAVGRAPADALKVAAKFLSRERSWSEESSVQHLITLFENASQNKPGKEEQQLREF